VHDEDLYGPHYEHGPNGEHIHPLWQLDRIELHSVGIDIGSSTSHLIFSTLEMRRQSAVLSSRFELVNRRIDYASPILLTPFVAGASLDVPKLSAFFEAAYAESGWRADSVDTGAVITTGDAARKDNAASVVQMFSEQAGKFVCASAGPLLESKMAAYGSGAVARSAHGAHPVTVLNIDVGGGTSKLAVVRDGRILEATAINVGARLITFDEAGILTKIERAAEIVAVDRGLSLRIGQPVPEETRQGLASALCDALLEVAARKPLSELARSLLIAGPLHHAGEVDVVIMSGGVSEYIYRDDVPGFGDIGSLIAGEIRRGLPKALPNAKLESPVQGIRATVIGASQFTAQVSGNTLHIGHPGLLPLRNLQVVPVTLNDDTPTAHSIADAVRQSLKRAEVDEPRPVALAVRWPHGPAYSGIHALSRGVADAMAEHIAREIPIVLVLDMDLARLTGAVLSELTDGSNEILCIDGVDLHEFDYIDIGEEHPESHVVTVIVKSLVFTG
jgi:ethanolamine utilization protein EutA